MGYEQGPMMYSDANGETVVRPSQTPIVWRISAYAAIRRDEELLMVLPTLVPLWCLPGGGIDSHETIADGVAREVFEETGYRAVVPELVPITVGEENFYWREREMFCNSLIMVYPAVLLSQEQDRAAINSAPDCPDEIARVTWVSLRDLCPQNVHSVHHAAVRRLQNGRR